MNEPESNVKLLRAFDKHPLSLYAIIFISILIGGLAFDMYLKDTSLYYFPE